MTIPSPRDLPSTGERFLTEWKDESAAEHLHRYAIAASLCHNKDVLDIASGEGYGSNLLAGTAKSVIGVDIASEAINHARKKYRRSNLKFLVGGALEIPVESHSQDVVVSFETLEHLVDHEQMIDEVHRVLKPEGLAVISTPDKRTYTDLRGTRNPYHVRELYTEEFRQLLTRRFANIGMYFQGVLMASLVLPEAASNGFEYFAGSPDEISRASTLPGALYNICVASNVALPLLPPSAFNADFALEERVRETTRRAQALENQLNRIRSSVSFRLGRLLTAPLRRLLPNGPA